MHLVNFPAQSSSTPSANKGFTLIEMAIVLVIIGLIVGGVLVGTDLIRAAGIRATISQIEKYNVAVNTFRGKYNALPGDLNQATASQFGFATRGTLAGQGDGDSVLRGFANGACGFCVPTGEQSMFWVDLTSANGLNINMIDGGFSTATPTTNQGLITGTYINLFMPAAKVGAGNYIYVWSGGPTLNWGSSETGNNGQNYYGLSVVTQMNSWELTSFPGLTVAQAYNIDKKVDDGMPQSGNVIAMYIAANTSVFQPPWAGTGGVNGPPYTTSVAGSLTTCFDNNSSSTGAPQAYSLGQVGGYGVNCALSFKFQ